MTRYLIPLSAIILLLAYPAEALRVMADDHVLASQEGRFMAGAEWWLPAIGLIMAAALGIVQWGIPHALYRFIGRRWPQTRQRLRLLFVTLSFLALWLGMIIFVFQRNANWQEHGGYILATLCGYLYVFIPCQLPRWLKRRTPQLPRWQRNSVGLCVFIALTIAVYFSLRLLTT